jgi:hypothetical protein
MGYVKGFIHNRNLATENLVRGYNTSSMLRHFPNDTVERLRIRLEVAPGWTAGASDNLLRMNLPSQGRGYGAVEITKTRRSARKHRTKNERVFHNHLVSLVHAGRIPRGSIPHKIEVIKWGVEINGSPWPSNSFIHYRRDKSPAEAGIVRMGTVVQYYSYVGAAKHDPVYVLINSHHVRNQRGVMLVVDATHYAQHVVHIDCLNYLFHLAPHYDVNITHLKCALPVSPAYPEVEVEDMSG